MEHSVQELSADVVAEHLVFVEQLNEVGNRRNGDGLSKERRTARTNLGFPSAPGEARG
jgi:hypothetical protein